MPLDFLLVLQLVVEGEEADGEVDLKGRDSHLGRMKIVKEQDERLHTWNTTEIPNTTPPFTSTFFSLSPSITEVVTASSKFQVA